MSKIQGIFIETKEMKECFENSQFYFKKLKNVQKDNINYFITPILINILKRKLT